MMRLHWLQCTSKTSALCDPVSGLLWSAMRSQQLGASSQQQTPSRLCHRCGSYFQINWMVNLGHADLLDVFAVPPSLPVPPSLDSVLVKPKRTVNHEPPLSLA